MTLHQLKIFESVARHLSITEAAEELHMSQPAVSHQLKLLQEEFEKSFYFSSHTGVQLTQEGKVFLREVKPILVRVKNVETKFKPKQKEWEHQFLIVGGNPTRSVTLLPEILAAFRRTHPLVTCQLETSDSRTIERRILNGKVEIAVITNPSYCHQIAVEPYGQHEVVAFVPSTSPLAGRNIALKNVAKLPLVVRGGGATVRELLRRGFKLNVAAQCEVPEAVKAAVKEGLGVGLLTRDSVKRDLMSGDLREVHMPGLQEIKVQSFIIHDKRRPLSSLAEDFRRILLERRTPNMPTKGKEALRSVTGNGGKSASL